MYPEELIAPMKSELENVGFTSLTTIEEVENEIKKEGTTLKIENLRDRWTQASIKRIFRYVSAIIQPFPLSELNEVVKSTINDLALVCSSCHKMLHRKRPWISINELKTLITNN